MSAKQQRMRKTLFKSWQVDFVLTTMLLTFQQSSALFEKEPLEQGDISDYKRVTYICDNSTDLSIGGNTTLKLWIDFINCTDVPQGFFVNLSNIVQTVVLSAPLTDNVEMVLFPEGVFENLGSVNYLQLRGFENGL